MAGFDEKKLKQIIDPTLAKAFTHPLRGHVWVTVCERGATSPTEIARELNLEVNEVSYHFRALKRRELIRVVRTEKRRGFDEHFYEPCGPALQFDDAEWMKIPAAIRATFSADLLKHIIDELVEALMAGSFDARSRHLSKSWLLVDDKGWKESQRVAQRALDQLQAIHERSARRSEDSGQPMIPVSAVIAVFETAAAAAQHEAGERKAL
jgi:DNA-binding transcriptional ArsR family regulator